MGLVRKIDYRLIVGFVFLVFLLFFASSGFAAVMTHTCDESLTDTDVRVRFVYASNSAFDISTAYESRHLAPCPTPSLCYVYLKAYADTSHQVYLAYSIGPTLRALGDCKSYEDVVWFNGLLGLAGVLSAGLLFYGIHSAFLN